VLLKGVAMAEVAVDIAGRSYRLGCGEGEEEHLQRLATLIDAEASALQRQFGNMQEARLFLMTSLLVADRLADNEQKLVELEQRLAELEGTANDLPPEREHELAEKVTSLAERIEKMATGKPTG